MPFLEILIVLVLVLLNAVLAAAELSIVSSRPARLKSMAEKGKPGAHAAMALAAEPGRFLSAVQIGITLIGILNGAFSGASLGAQLGDALRAAGLPPGVAAPLSYALVVAARPDAYEETRATLLVALATFQPRGPTSALFGNNLLVARGN